jgi:hypothetical protein
LAGNEIFAKNVLKSLNREYNQLKFFIMKQMLKKTDKKSFRIIENGLNAEQWSGVFIIICIILKN